MARRKGYWNTNISASILETRKDDTTLWITLAHRHRADGAGLVAIVRDVYRDVNDIVVEADGEDFIQFVTVGGL